MGTAVAARLTDISGHTTTLDKGTYAAVQAFLQALGVPMDANKEDDDVRLTTGQAAKILGTSSRTVARLVDSGALSGYRIGTGHRTVMLSDIMEFKHDSEINRHTKLEKARSFAAEGNYYEHNDAMEAYLGEFE